MELKSNNASSVLTDSVPKDNKSMRTIRSSKYIAIPRKMAEILDNTWLEAMKSSSPPPHKKRITDFNVEVASDDYDLSYYSWVHKHPSALKLFRQIANHAKNKKIAIFLDYDGTLSPIVDDPDRAFMSDVMRSAVKNVAEYFPTAIISGRSRDKVYEFVGLSELYYAGSHGMDIKGPSKNFMTVDHEDMVVNLFQPATKFLPMINEVFRLLVDNMKGIVGAKVENHKFCVSVHYRNVEENNWGMVAERVHDILKSFPHLRLTHGRKVLEIRPVIDWNKGKAVEFLLDSLGLSDREDVVSIYIGDDTTDEDAFKFIREGNRGYGILVSGVAKETKASYSLRDPSEVMEFLKCLVSWRKR